MYGSTTTKVLSYEIKYDFTCTEVLSYESTFVRNKVRKYFRTSEIFSYESTSVLPYVYDATLVALYEGTYWLRRYGSTVPEVRKYLRKYENS